MSSQLRQPRLAEVVASVLRERILDGQLGDGAELPKQDELLDEFRISRPSLREALRILENEGLLTVRRGNVGGSVVELPTAESSAYMFGLVLQSRRASIASLAQAIQEIEPITASLCAQREDRESTVLPPLRANIDACEAVMGETNQFTQLARQFHEEMVKVCGNETLILMVGALESLWTEQERNWAQRAERRGTYPGESYRRDVQNAHKAIVAAIAEGKADRAATLARKHLSESQHYALSESRDSQVIRATGMRSGFAGLT